MIIPNANKYINDNINHNQNKERYSTFFLKNNNKNFDTITFKSKKINKLIKKPGFLKKAGSFFAEKYNNIFKKEINPNALGFANYGSKILISPLMIFMIAPFTKDWKNPKDKELIKSSAILHPIQAGLTLALATVTGFVANKTTDYFAKKGNLGNFIDPELGNFFNPKKNPKNLAKLKNINTAVFTLLMIPVASEVLNLILPKVLKKHKSSGRVHHIYSTRLSPYFCNNKQKTGKIYA